MTKQTLRVTFCAYDFPNYVGGPNAWLLRLLPQLDAVGIKCNVLFFTLDTNNSPTAESLASKGIPSSSFSFSRTTRKKVNWILKKISENPPDIFIPNLVIPAYFASGWIRAAGIPTIGILHSDDNFYHAIVDEFSRKEGFFSLSAVVCVSDYLMKTVQANASKLTSVFKIPYGVPVPDQMAGEPTDRLKIIFVGRLEEEQKRISEVARAFCRVVNQVPGTEARIYGDGPAASSIARILQNEDPLGLVEMVGRVPSDEIQSHMLENHVVVLLSDYEGLPIALLESMACGLVPICKDISSGIPELLQNGKNGLIVQDRDNSFILAVRELKNSNKTWLSLSRNARETVTRSYSDKACADRWTDVLRTISARSTCSKPPAFPHVYRMPTIRSEFLREDFRGHHLFSRVLNKILRIIYLDRSPKR